jgi:hypothetical protein
MFLEKSISDNWHIAALMRLKRFHKDNKFLIKSDVLDVVRVRGRGCLDKMDLSN